MPGGGPDARRPTEAEGAYPGAGSGGSGAEPTAASQPHGDTYKNVNWNRICIFFVIAAFVIGWSAPVVRINRNPSFLLLIGLFFLKKMCNCSTLFLLFSYGVLRRLTRESRVEANSGQLKTSSSSSGCVNPKWAPQARACTQRQGRSDYKPAGYCWRCRERRGREIAEPLLHICTCNKCGGGCIVCSSTISAATPVLDMQGESHVLKSLLATSPGWSRQAACSGLSPVRRPLESVLSARRRKPLGTTKECEDCGAAAHWAVSCCGAHLCSACLDSGARIQKQARAMYRRRSPGDP